MLVLQHRWETICRFWLVGLPYAYGVLDESHYFRDVPLKYLHVEEQMPLYCVGVWSPRRGIIPLYC